MSPKERCGHIKTSSSFKSSVRFDWEIDSGFLASQQGLLYSPEFLDASIPKVKWKLLLDFSNSTEDTKDWIAVFVRPRNLLDSIIVTGGEISISNVTKSIPFRLHQRAQRWGWVKFIKKSEFKLRELGDEASYEPVRVSCTLETCHHPDLKHNNEQYNLSTSLTNCPTELNSTDLIIYCDGNEIEAHALLLAGRSPVFRAMLTCNMKEAKTHRIEIPDIELEIFENLIEYIYTGRCSILLSDKDQSRYNKHRLTCDNIFDEDIEFSQPDEETDELKLWETTELLKASDKYQLDDLRFACELKLIKMITNDTATFLLAFADTNNSTLLKQYAMQYICSNSKSIARLKGWAELVENRCDLVDELVGSFQGMSLSLKHVLALQPFELRAQPKLAD